MRTLYLMVFCCAALLFGGCEEKQTQQAAPAPVVRVVPATKGYVFKSASAIGSAKAYDEVNLVARVEGFLNKRHFEEGDSVKAGQLLYEIEPEVYAAKVKSAEAAVEKAKANQSNAEIEYDRQKKLSEKDATSGRAFDNASATKREADADVAAAEAELALAQRNLSYTKINSPFDGMVGLSAVSEGNLVDKSTGTLATVVKIDPMRVEFVINELDLIELLKLRSEAGVPDIRVRLFLQDGSEYDQPGKISFWDNRIGTTTGTLRMQAVFPNPKHELVTGMFVRINIGLDKASPSLLIPLLAVMADQAGDYVYVVGADNLVSRRDIRTGYRDRVNVAVESGLKEGDRVITEGVQKVRPGASAAPETDHAAQSRIPLTPEAALAVDVPKGESAEGTSAMVDGTLTPAGEKDAGRSGEAGK